MPSTMMDFTTRPLQLPTKSYADNVKASSVVARYDLTGMLLLLSCDRAREVLSFGDVSYASCGTDPRTITLTMDAHTRDAAQASLDARVTALSTASNGY